MKIKCDRCKKPMGEILKGSNLRKGIVYLCKECNRRARIAESSLKGNTGFGLEDLMGMMK